jgi:hypothetical protein
MIKGLGDLVLVRAIIYLANQESQSTLLPREVLMTRQEHELMVLMFARLYEAMGVIKETLKSRELWTADDERAFSHAVHDDNKKLAEYFFQAMKDYLRLAQKSGVVTGLEPPNLA